MVSYNNERDLARIIEDLQKRLKTLEGSTTGPQTLEERAEIRKPAAPTGFTVSSYVDFNAAGQAQSIIKGTWYPVKITNGYNDSYYTEIKIRCYELWAKESNLSDDYYQVVATTDSADSADEISVTFIAVANKEYDVKVTAVGQDYNTRGEWSSVQTISAIADTTPPDIPTPPIVTDESGAAKIMWDGLPIMPVDFNYVEVGYHTLPTSSPEIVGRLYDSTNTVIITPEYDEKTYYYLRAVDYSGNSSSWSPVTIATIQQPPLSEGNKDEISTMLEELDNNIQQDITSIVNDVTTALDLAGSKANVHVSETAPGEEFENEDSLWLDIKDRHYAWTGNENASSSTESDGVNGVIRENKATNPRFKGLSGDTVEVRRNLLSNPGAVSTAGYTIWFGTPGAEVSQSVVNAAWSKSGKAARATWSAVSSPVSGDCGVNLLGLGLTPGEIYTAAVYLHYSDELTTFNGQPTIYTDSSITHTAQGYVPIGANADKLVKCYATFVCPDPLPTDNFHLYIKLLNGATAGSWMELSMADLYPGEYDPSREWFSGDYSPDPDLQPVWTGTENASQSYLRGFVPRSTYSDTSKIVTYSTSQGAAMLPTSSTTSDSGILLAGSASTLSGQGVTFTQGKWVGASCLIRVSEVQTGSLSGYARSLRFVTKSSSAGTVMVGSNQADNTEGVYPVQVIAQIPSDATLATIQGFNGALFGNAPIYLDDLLIVEGDSEEEVQYKLANGFFDGNSTNTPANTVKYWDDTEKAWIPSQTNKAQETADQAITAAAEAFSAANLVQAAMNGLISTGYTQPVDPVKGSLWFQQRTDDDAIIGLYIYNGSQWKDYTLIANKLYVLGADGAVYIGDGLVKSNSIATEAVETKHLGSNTVTTEKLSVDVIEVLNKADAWATKTTIDSNGITISNGENSLRLTETQLKFLVGDTPVAWIDSVTQNMTIDTLSIATSITVGHHKIEKYVIQGSTTPTGITIIRQGA